MRFETLKKICWIEASFLNKDGLKLTGDLQINYEIYLRGDECAMGTIGCEKYFEIQDVIWHRDKEFNSSLHCKGYITMALTDEEFRELEEKINEGNGYEF